MTKRDKPVTVSQLETAAELIGRAADQLNASHRATGAAERDDHSVNFNVSELRALVTVIEKDPSLLRPRS